MAYTKLPVIPLELDELLELEELDELLELDELEDELEEFEDELDELDDELLEELLEDPVVGGVCEPPQAANRVISERESKCRIFKVKPSEVVGFSNRYCDRDRFIAP